MTGDVIVTTVGVLYSWRTIQLEDYTVGKLTGLTVNVTRVLQTVLLATVILNILDSSVAILDSSVAILDSSVAILDSSVAILDIQTD